MPDAFVIARSTDRQVVEALAEIATELKLNDARIRINGVDGFLDHTFACSQWQTDKEFQQISALQSSVLNSSSLVAGGQGHQLLSVTRDGKSIQDFLNFNYQSAQQGGVKGAHFALLLAVGKQKLRAIEINSEFSSTGLERFDTMIRARFGELEELRSIGGRVSVQAHDRMLELDRAYQERCKQQDEQLAERRRELKEEIDGERAKLQERAESLDARAAELDLSDSKAARRKLRQDLRETLTRHSQRFELSSTTRAQRWPVGVLLLVAIASTGWMTYVAFGELAASVSDPNGTWWRVATVSLKQLFFAITFLGFATYTLRWFEGWSRRHADAEFRFKQLELDIDRASWVVEVALEWRQQQGAELPKELLAQLSSGLFSERDTDGAAPVETLASLIFGTAANLKLKTPGVDLEFDKKGLRQLGKE